MVSERDTGTRRWWWVVVVGLVLGAAAGYVLGGSADRVESATQLLVTGAGETVDPGLDSALTSNQYVSQRMPTYAALATTNAVTQRATDALGLEEGALGGAITATAVPDTSVVDIVVAGPGPEEAQSRAVAVTDALQAVITESENAPGQPARVRLSVVSPAGLPDAPTLGSTAYLVAGAILGLGGGLFAAYSLGRRDQAEARRRRSFEASLPPRGAPPQQANGRAGAAPPRRPTPAEGYPGRDRP